jgi:hypothetical protein
VPSAALGEEAVPRPGREPVVTSSKGAAAVASVGQAVPAVPISSSQELALLARSYPRPSPRLLAAIRMVTLRLHFKEAVPAAREQAQEAARSRSAPWGRSP